MPYAGDVMCLNCGRDAETTVHVAGLGSQPACVRCASVEPIAPIEATKEEAPASRALPLPALDNVEWFDVEIPADLERSRDWYRREHGENVGMLATCSMINTGCGKAGRVHPRSYAARFAREERAFERRLEAYEARLVAHEAARMPPAEYGADHSEVSATKAHPRSYGADFPLRRFTDAQLTRATKEDKAAWAARPLTYASAADTEAWQARYVATYNADMSATTRAKVFAKTYARLGVPALDFAE